jgi:HEAT repeat protein
MSTPINRGLVDALRRLADASEPLRLSALYPLSDLNRDDVVAVQQVWEQLPDERRREVVTSMVELSETVLEVDFTALFRLVLGDNDPRVRIAAIEGLWETEQAWLARALVGLLQCDPEPAVRSAAAEALGRFILLGELGDLDSVLAAAAEEALLRAYGSAEQPMEVKRRSLESLGYSSDVSVGEVIAEAYRRGSEEVRLSALFAMGRSADRRWRPVLLDELGSPSAAHRYAAALACGELELREAVGPLSELVDDEDGEVWNVAVEALGKIGGVQARQVLQSVCEGRDGGRSAVAADALERTSWATDDELEVLDDWTVADSC